MQVEMDELTVTSCARLETWAKNLAETGAPHQTEIANDALNVLKHVRETLALFPDLVVKDAATIYAEDHDALKATVSTLQLNLESVIDERDHARSELEKAQAHIAELSTNLAKNAAPAPTQEQPVDDQTQAGNSQASEADAKGA